MTPEEIREALQAHGMCSTASLISGYSKTCVSDFKRNGSGSDELVQALSIAVPRAQTELSKRQSEMVFEGTPCRRHGLTTRYVCSGQCVECAKFFARKAP